MANPAVGAGGAVVVVEETFLLIKPDAAAHHREVLQAISDAGLQIVMRSLKGLTRRQAEMVVAQYPYIQSLFHREHLSRLERDGEATAGEFTARLRAGSTFYGGGDAANSMMMGTPQRSSSRRSTLLNQQQQQQNGAAPPANPHHAAAGNNYQQFSGRGGVVAVGDLADAASPTSAFYKQRVKAVGEADGAPAMSKSAALDMARQLPSAAAVAVPTPSPPSLGRGGGGGGGGGQNNNNHGVPQSPRPPRTPQGGNSATTPLFSSSTFQNSTAGGAGIGIGGGRGARRPPSADHRNHNNNGGNNGIEFDTLPNADDRDAVPFSQPQRVDLYSPYHGTYGRNRNEAQLQQGSLAFRPGGGVVGGGGGGGRPSPVVGSSSSTGGIFYNNSMDASLLFSVSLQQQQQKKQQQQQGSRDASPLNNERDNKYGSSHDTDAANSTTTTANTNNNSRPIDRQSAVLVGESLMSAWLRSPARHQLASRNAALLPSFPMTSNTNTNGSNAITHFDGEGGGAIGGTASLMASAAAASVQFGATTTTNLNPRGDVSTEGAVLTTAPPTTEARVFVPKGPSPALRLALAKGQWSPAEIAFETAVDYLVAGGTCLALSISGVRAISRVAELTFGFSVHGGGGNGSGSGGSASSPSSASSSMAFQNQQQHAMWTREACRVFAPYSFRALYAAGGGGGGGGGGGSAHGFRSSPSPGRAVGGVNERGGRGGATLNSTRNNTNKADASSSDSNNTADSSALLYNGFFCPLRFSEAALLIRAVFGYESSQHSQLLAAAARRSNHNNSNTTTATTAASTAQLLSGSGGSHRGGEPARPILDMLDVDDDHYINRLMRRFNAEAESLRRSAGARGGRGAVTLPPSSAASSPRKARRQSSSSSSDAESLSGSSSSSDDDDDGEGDADSHYRRSRRRRGKRGGASSKSRHRSRQLPQIPNIMASVSASSVLPSPYSRGFGGERSRLSATSDSREQALQRQQQVLHQMVSVLAEEQRSIQLETRKLRVNELELLLREQRLMASVAAAGNK